MKIVKTNVNNYTITGVTKGKLLAIQRALTVQLNTSKLTPVGEDILMAIDDALKDKEEKVEVTFEVTGYPTYADYEARKGEPIDDGLLYLADARKIGNKAKKDFKFSTVKIQSSDREFIEII